MSLSLGVDVTHTDGARLTAAIGTLLCGLLILAAVEQFAGQAYGQGWLCLACALGCAAWCSVQCRRLARCRSLRLQIQADGAVAVAAAGTRPGTRPGTPDLLPAAVATAWRLGGLICLRLRPAADDTPAGAQAMAAWRLGIGSGVCLLLLTTRSCDHASWHALRRWLVWHRRSHRRDVAAA
jgi:hypothetical protein